MLNFFISTFLMNLFTFTYDFGYFRDEFKGVLTYLNPNIYNENIFNPPYVLDFILTNTYIIILMFLLEIVLFFLGRLFFKSFNIETEFKNLFLYNFIFKFIPIFTHIGSFLTGVNNNKIKVGVKSIFLGYFNFILVGIGLSVLLYILYYFINSNFLYFINQIYLIYSYILFGFIGIIWAIFYKIKRH